MQNIGLIGADEVGVGDYFGGIVTCACYVDDEIKTKLATFNIQDSKKITNENIIKLAKQLMQIVPYCITDLTPQQYNFLFDKYKNAHVIKTYAHNLSITNLKKQYPNAKVVLDQYATQANYLKYIAQIKPEFAAKIDIVETKAESKYICVAIASIIARYYFLKQIATLSKSVNINLPLGYNKANLDVAINKLKHKFQDKFEQAKIRFVKLHFKYE